MSKKKTIPVCVEWIDSMGCAGWGDYTPSNMNCVSVGFLVEKNKDRVILALNKSLHVGRHGDYMEIPLCAVKRIRKLK